MALDKSWFILSSKKKDIKGFADPHVRFTPALAEKFISSFSRKGDLIFDPFSGFGTTLLAAKRLGRVGIGIEYDKNKFDWLHPQLQKPHQVILGSSLELSKFKLPKMDMSLTSPPYMRYFDKQSPLSNYTKQGGYADYLKGIGKIYAQIKKIMKKDAAVIVEIENTFGKNHPATPLAWDVAREISKHLYFERDFIQCYEEGKLAASEANNNHSYCLLFRNKE